MAAPNFTRSNPNRVKDLMVHQTNIASLLVNTHYHAHMKQLKHPGSLGMSSVFITQFKDLMENSTYELHERTSQIDHEGDIPTDILEETYMYCSCANAFAQAVGSEYRLNCGEYPYENAK